MYGFMSTIWKNQWRNFDSLTIIKQGESPKQWTIVVRVPLSEKNRVYHVHALLDKQPIAFGYFGQRVVNLLPVLAIMIIRVNEKTFHEPSNLMQYLTCNN